MKYAVSSTHEADANIEEAFRYIYERSPLSATRWLRGIYQAIDTLEILPRRCAVAPESEILGEELRHYIYKLHRIIFRIEEKAKIVRIVHVRHSARLPLGQEGPDPDKE